MDIDLKAYGVRIGHTGDWRPTAECLRELHLAHATHVPFENLDILLGRPILLDLESLWKKLVGHRRGGYCFEQNALFAAVLEAAGFKVKRLAARVRTGVTSPRPRTHMLLMVEAGGGQWLADVGFGAEGLLYPISFQLDVEVTHFVWKYRLIAEGPAYVLQSARPEGWLDLYAFTLEEQLPIDYEPANHYTSTYPTSIFRRMVRVQRPGADLRLMLVNRKLIEWTAEGTRESVLADDAAMLKVLSERFGLEFPAGTRFSFEEALG